MILCALLWSSAACSNCTYTHNKKGCQNRRGMRANDGLGTSVDVRNVIQWILYIDPFLSDALITFNTIATTVVVDTATETLGMPLNGTGP